MNLCVSHIDDHGMKFVLKGASDAFANSIRRTMMCEVDALAISTVEIITNTTAFPDEILAHRLGMVPLVHTDDEHAEYVLNIRSYSGDVFSDGIIPTSPNAPRAQPGIFLLPMQSDQVLHIKAHARRGIPLEHARYGTCVAPAYAIRHDGVQFEECICDGTERNTLCANCGNMSATHEASRGHLVHNFSFETTGIHPSLLLQRSLQVLHTNIMNLHAALA
jgi:DNA-directed RNA polymerase alpha subunit